MRVICPRCDEAYAVAEPRWSVVEILSGDTGTDGGEATVVGRLEGLCEECAKAIVAKLVGLLDAAGHGND